MEPYKENIETLRITTRLPLPIKPLPALPRHLLKESKIMRKALRTISNENVAGPSHAHVTHKKKRKILIDTKHVTFRSKKEELSNYNVFVEDNVKVIHIDNSDHRKKDNEEVLNRVVSDSSEGVIEATPSKSPILEPIRVRNVKRSLKRAHSRELQGISPLVSQENKEQDKVKRQLRFNESFQDRSLDFLNRSYTKNLDQEYASDIFSYLITTERKPLDVPRTPSMTRSCVMNWIMKINGILGNPGVVQTAFWYLDSVLATTPVELDQLQLIGAACFWIAQKLYGPVFSAKKIVKLANNAFSTHRLQAAEEAVLKNLRFPTLPVVAQEFINYLSWWLDNGHPEEIEIAATFICMCGLMVDKSLCDEYPSVIAAASIRNSLLLLRKRDLIMRLHMSTVYKSALRKATDIACIHSRLRKAVRMVASPYYEYKAPFEHYGLPPVYIAQRIIHAANDFAVIDTRNIKH